MTQNFFGRLYRDQPVYVLPGIPDGSMRRYYSIDNNHTYLLLSKYMYIDNFNRH
jgi:hypothetical protein